MTDINIHIGCHGIFDLAIDSFARGPEVVSDLDGINMISSSAYRKNWKSAVTVGGDDVLRDAKSSVLTELLVRESEQLHVLSNPRILGSDSGFLKGGQVYSEAEKRMARLGRVIDIFDVSIRLIICEFNLFCRLNNESSTGAAAEFRPWASLIHRLAAGGAGVDIRVFAVIDPRLAASALSDILFDPGVSKSQALMEMQSAALRDFVASAGNAPTQEEMRLYEDDLAVISGMDVVSLKAL